MLILSTPGAPVLALTRFHGSAILAVETTCSTDARSIGDGPVTRHAPKSPVGVNELHELTGIPPHTAVGPFPGTLAGFSSSGEKIVGNDFSREPRRGEAQGGAEHLCPVNTRRRRRCSTTPITALRQADFFVTHPCSTKKPGFGSLPSRSKRCFSPPGKDMIFSRTTAAFTLPHVLRTGFGMLCPPCGAALSRCAGKPSQDHPWSWRSLLDRSSPQGFGLLCGLLATSLWLSLRAR